jgi:hypothetical protein
MELDRINENGYAIEINILCKRTRKKKTRKEKRTEEKKRRIE